MTHSLGLIELPLSALEWNCVADYDKLKAEGIELEDYINKLRVSIEAEGIKKPPVVEWHLHHTSSSGNRFNVLEGNHRLEVALGLGIKKTLCEFRVITYGNEWIVTGLKHLLQGVVMPDKKEDENLKRLEGVCDGMDEAGNMQDI